MSAQTKIKQEVKRLQSPAYIKSIEKAINLYLNNLMQLTREECTFLKEEDFTLLTLLYAGLKTNAVCLLMGINDVNYYKRKSRIKKRILDSETPHKTLFLNHLS